MGRWRLPLEPAQVDRRYLAMLIGFEEQALLHHHGVDPWAIGRAAWQLARHGRIISGGSTLTMQVARLLLGEHRRTAAGKFPASADRAELGASPLQAGDPAALSAAGAVWRQPRRRARRLASPISAKKLAACRWPRRRCWWRSHRPGAASARTLAGGSAAGAQSRARPSRRHARSSPPRRAARHGGAHARQPPRFSAAAPHLADAEVQRDKARLVHELTLDARVQANLERLVEEHAETQPGRLSAALIAVDHRTGEVLAQVGSPGYLDGDRFGALDMTSAVRSPAQRSSP
jgi:penicillin-binding protein 1C